MSNSTRIVNQKPIIDVSEDILSTNRFIPTIDRTEDLTKYQRESFREYIETTKRNNQVDKAIKNTKDNDYDFFSNVPASINRTTVISKEQKDIIKIEVPSIIDIDTEKRDKNLYPQPSSFTMPLGKTFYNIKSIELVSTGIPNTDQTITNTPVEIQNNKISWQNLEDIDLGRYLNCSITSTGDYVDINIPRHGLGSQARDGKFYIKVTNSTSTPSINGSRFAEILDTNTLRIPFMGGIAATATADVDTGFPNYNIELTPGNYTASTLATEIQTQLNLIKRRNGIGIFHYFTVEVNLDTDVLTFSSYITQQLQVAPLSTTSGSGIVTVTSLAHGFKSGDYALIIGSKSTGGLSSTLLNGLFIIDVLNSDTFTYEVVERASASGNGGGSAIKTGKPSKFRLLFDTSNSLIVYNIGFPDEDSSELLGTSTTPITTKALSISNAVINGSYVTFTSNNHGLVEAGVYTILNITVGNVPIVTTTTPHNLSDATTAYIYYPSSDPPLNSFYPITVTGDTTFRLDTTIIVSNTGGMGLLKHGGDTVLLNNFKSVPTINQQVYIVENITSNTFEINATLEEIQTTGISSTVVGTRQVNIYHPNHGFNSITSIAADTATTALVTTKVPHGLVGTKYLLAPKITTILSTVDITVAGHGLSTSDTVLISDSVGGADIGGSYYVQVISTDVFRISFIGGTDAGTCSVNIGDSTTFSDTDSVPSISTSFLGKSIFYVDTVSPTSFRIDTGFQITTHGNFGILGRSNKVAIHRVTASEIGGSTLGGIPLTAINHNYYELANIVDVDNYMLRVSQHATSTVSSGGSDVVITSERNGYRTFQSNTSDGTTSGSLYRSISLEGVNHLYLVCNGLSNVFLPGNNGNIGDVFAKVVLSEPPGNMLFNTFVSVPKIFNPPLASLKSLKFEMKRSDGILFNFNDINYSMSLRVVEIVDRIIDSSVSARTGVSDLF